MTGLGQNLVDAITLGSSYALLGIGIALVFGIMRLVNFAHGELVMVAAYGTTLASHAPWPVTLLVTLLVPVAFALVMDRFAFKLVRGAPEATMLVTSFAVSLLIQNVALLLFSSTPRSVDLAPALNGSFAFGGLALPRLDLVTVVVTGCLFVLLNQFLNRTNLGIHLRASAEDLTTARLLGVRANRVIAIAFAISGVLCGVAGYLEVVRSGQVFPTMGLNAILVAFVATTLGGLGSLPGAVAGGYVLGAITVFLGAYLPENLRAYTDAFTYALVIAVLVYRPQGLVIPKSTRSRV